MQNHVLRISRLTLLSVLLACGGATTGPDAEEDVDLPDDIEEAAGPLVSAGEGDARDGDDNAGTSSPDAQRPHRKRIKRRIFRLLDWLDGERDGAIAIASLPAHAPPMLITKLHAIDGDGDGVVTRAEARAALRAHRSGG